MWKETNKVSEFILLNNTKYYVWKQNFEVNMTLQRKEYKVLCEYKLIVLVKMFSQWFFANEKTNITSTALKICDLTEDVMT